MPLVILCGLPSSGKTRRARELQTWLEKAGHTVNVVNDEALGIDRRAAYADPAEEKKARGALQASVERALGKKTVVIADGLNYIKGFRYQLHCAARALGTPQCVIECAATLQQLREWNHDRADGYTDAVVDELIARYEAPTAMNRWDRPLFVLTAEDPLPTEAIAEALFQGRSPNPNLATRAMPLSDTNYVYELDRTTQAVLQQIQEAQRLNPGPGAVEIAGASLAISAGSAKRGGWRQGPGTRSQPVPLTRVCGPDGGGVERGARHVQLRRSVTPAELQRHRQQFLHINRLNSLKSIATLTDVFVQYLNTCLGHE